MIQSLLNWLSPAARKRRRGSQFAAERLEDKTLLSGNVSVFTTGGGDIRVVGNSGDNEINVEVDGSTLRVSGVAGTTINWGAGPAEFDLSSLNLRDLRFAMGLGNDVVTINADLNLGGDLILYTHGGTDTINVSGNISADKVVISGGGDADLINISGTTSVDVTVVAGDDLINPDGDDTIHVNNVNAGRDFKLIASLGINSAILDNVHTNEDLRLWGSNDDDHFVISRSSAQRNLVVVTAGGQNDVGIAGVTVGKDLKILGGSGNDIVGLYGDLVDSTTLLPVGPNNITRNLAIIMYGGDDSIEVRGEHNIGGKAYLYANAGTDDRINRTGLSDDDVAREQEFEHENEPFHIEVENVLEHIENEIETPG
ncbi:MAG: DUF4402 domain-containing protein [Planctomycetaceae bacterium]|nr:DUF4402 domain-containing protein [Planctomycetaceae bacterium]